MKILITGAKGFLGMNLCSRLAEHKEYELISYTRDNHISELPSLLCDVDFVFHLAGVNRPENSQEYLYDNVDLTSALCSAISINNRKIPVAYTSSTQATLDNSYGISKRAAENALFDLQENRHNPVYVYRLANVFGKWCRPNHHSVVTTFCYNISRGLPIHVNNPEALLSLIYVDDVIDHFMGLLPNADFRDSKDLISISPEYTIRLDELVDQILEFKSGRKTLMVGGVGMGLVRALYSTYISYLPKDKFAYSVPRYADSRGSFVEMIKTPSSGQFSYFTAGSGITRGGHYHHSKTEKFLVIIGVALFRFCQISTGQTFELIISGGEAKVVDSIPGWAHDVTNIGDNELVVMLWSNEVFDRDRPDTIAYSIKEEK